MAFRNLRRNCLLFSCLRVGGDLHKKELVAFTWQTIRIFLSTTWDKQRLSELELARQQCLCHCEAEVASRDQLREILAVS